jgi:hypothetical protein
VAKLSGRRLKRAIERQDAGYPEPLRRSASVVAQEDWVSQFEAAEALRIGVFRVGALVSAGTLEPVHDATGRAGVSRQSLERECAARSTAGPVRRAGLFMKDLGRSLARGI